MDDSSHFNNVFPQFDDGDTVITITAGWVFRLHSSILCRLSPFFQRVLTNENAVFPERAVSNGVAPYYRLSLVEDDEGEFAEFVLKFDEVDENGMAVEGTTEVAATFGGQPKPAFAMAWEQVLGAFYHRTIDIGDFEENGVPSMARFAIGITEVPLIVKPVEAALLATGQRLQSDVAEAPETYLDFGFRLQSKVLFREALIHGAGRFNSARVQEALQDNVYPRCVVKLLCQKAQQLVSASRMTQIQISSYYPEEMPRELATGRADRDSIGRNSYSNDILCWIGLTAFRQWLQQMVVNDKTHHAPDMGFKFFKTLAAGHDAYLDAHGLADFHFTFPMSQKGVAVVENKKMLHNNSKLDTHNIPVDHFTCTQVHQEDYPWDMMECFDRESVSEEEVYELGELRNVRSWPENPDVEVKDE